MTVKFSARFTQSYLICNPEVVFDDIGPVLMPISQVVTEILKLDRNLMPRNAEIEIARFALPYPFPDIAKHFAMQC